MMTDSGQTEYGGFERRKYFRYNIIYSPKEAKLAIGNHEYKVLDTSFVGLRFEAKDNMPFEKEIHGTLTFSDGESRAVQGSIVWMQDNEIGLKFLK